MTPEDVAAAKAVKAVLGIYDGSNASNGAAAPADGGAPAAAPAEGGAPAAAPAAAPAGPAGIPDEIKGAKPTPSLNQAKSEAPKAPETAIPAAPVKAASPAPADKG